MSGYSAFARYYDELTANIDYKKRGEYFHSIIQRFKTTKENILLDLACGTGSISEVMAGLGYDVIGVDNSDEMLGIALDKKFDSGLDIQYLCQDMRKLDMFGTVDITVCALDSINHLASINYEEKTFEWGENGVLIIRRYRNQYNDGELIETVLYNENGIESLRETRDSQGNLVGSETEEPSAEDLS